MNDDSAGTPDNYGPQWFAVRRAEARERYLLRQVQRRFERTEAEELVLDMIEENAGTYR